MAELKVSGRVVKVYPTQQVTEKLKKRQLVIEEDSNPKYPQIVVMDFVQDKTALLDNLNTNDRVTVDFNFNGRAYQKPGEETKYFSGIQGWKLSIDGSAPHNQGMGAPTNAPTVSSREEDPF